MVVEEAAHDHHRDDVPDAVGALRAGKSDADDQIGGLIEYWPPRIAGVDGRVDCPKESDGSRGRGTGTREGGMPGAAPHPGVAGRRRPLGRRGGGAHWAAGRRRTLGGGEEALSGEAA